MLIIKCKLNIQNLWFIDYNLWLKCRCKFWKHLKHLPQCLSQIKKKRNDLFEIIQFVQGKCKKYATLLKIVKIFIYFTYSACLQNIIGHRTTSYLSDYCGHINRSVVFPFSAVLCIAAVLKVIWNLERLFIFLKADFNKNRLKYCFEKVFTVLKVLKLLKTFHMESTTRIHFYLLWGKSRILILKFTQFTQTLNRKIKHKNYTVTI